MVEEYKAFILCSIKKSEANFVDMIENAFLDQGFHPFTIGKNPYATIDRKFLIDTINTSQVIVIIITHEDFLDLVNEILEDNKTIFNIKKKPIMIFYDKKFYDQLDSKGTYSVIIENSRIYGDLDLQEKINKFVAEFKNKVDDRELVKNLGKTALVLGGIGIGLNFLFSIFKGDE